MHNKCGRKLGVVAHEGSNKEKNTHLVPENSGRKSGVVAREGVVLRSFTVFYNRSLNTKINEYAMAYQSCHLKKKNKWKIEFIFRL